MKQLQRPLLTITAFLLCVNWGMDQGKGGVSGGGVQPAVNFMGKVTDNTGKTFDVSHINISGLYKQIPVYATPNNLHDSNYDPSINTIRLDLAEIATLEMLESDLSYTFKNRKYVPITIHSKSGTKQDYLMEANKRVLCNQTDKSGPVERELAPAAVKKIEIHGYVVPEDKPDTSSKKQTPQHSVKHHTAMPHSMAQPAHVYKRVQNKPVTHSPAHQTNQHAMQQTHHLQSAPKTHMPATDHLVNQDDTPKQRRAPVLPLKNIAVTPQTQVAPPA